METWPTKKLKDLLEICDTGVWGKPAVRGKGLFVLRSTNMSNEGNLDFSDVAERNVKGNINKLKLLDGDILVEKSGGGPDQPVGRVAYFTAPNDEVYAFANFIQRIRVRPDLMDSYFLFYYLLFLHKIGFTKRLQSQTTGIRNLKLSLYLKTEIPVPSLKTQKQIVERLDKIVAAQKLNDGLIQKAGELFQSLLHKELNPAGKDWGIKKLGEVISFEKGKKMTTADDGDSYIGIKNLRSGSYSIYTKEKHGVRCVSNDVLLAWDGAYAGTVGIGLKGFVGSTIVKVLHNKPLEGGFLFYLLNLYRSKIRSAAQGVAIPHLNKTFINNLKIPFPPLKTQKQIAAKLSAAQEYKTQLLAQRAKLKELFDSVLHKSMKNE